MKIAIEARALTTKSAGVRRYVEGLLQALSQYVPQESVTLIQPGRITSQSWILPLWYQWGIPHTLQHIQPDLIHFTKATVSPSLTIPSVVTIFDVIPLLLPSTQTSLQRLYWKRALAHAASRADAIITISDQSRQDITEHFHVDPKKITVTSLAVDSTVFYPIHDQHIIEETRAAYNLTKPYILFVGTRDRRKNIDSLLRAFERIHQDIPHDLVLVGKAAARHDDTDTLRAHSPAASRIRILEHVPHAHLAPLYSQADLFVYPSLYEGWGFPPQEAMACGTPVIVSDGGSLPEVVGDAGITVPLGKDFVESLTQSIMSVLTNTTLAEDLSRKGIEQAKKYTWQSVAEKTLDVYKHVTS